MSRKKEEMEVIGEDVISSILKRIKDSIEGKILCKLLENKGAMTLKELKDEMNRDGIKVQKTAYIVNKLEENGYIKKIKYRGLSRSVFVTLTDQGRVLAEKLVNLEEM